MSILHWNGSNDASDTAGAHMVDYHMPQRLSTASRFPYAWGRIDLAAATGAGLLSGALALAVLLALSVSVYDESAWKLMRMIAALAWGPNVLEPDDEFSFAVVATALALTFMLALGYAFALSLLVKDVPEATAPWIGLAFGVALYFVNLYGLGQAFPWFAPFRTFDTLLVHILFGIVAATAYRQLAAAHRHRAKGARRPS
jgi:hypothetical protein